MREELKIIDDMNQGNKAPLFAYLNRQTKEGFTALHFASFKGNIETMDLLI